MKDKEADIERVIAILSEKERFLLLTHKDPDLDGVGSMIALGYALRSNGKDVVLFSETKLNPPLTNIKGAEEITYELDSKERFDATVTLDCSNLNRLAQAKEVVMANRPLINIDHHETNDYFGDLNFVFANSSSTGELVFNLIKKAQFSINSLIAEALFAAIQADTGCFKYENTTPESLRIASELLEHGISPWNIYRNTNEQYTISALKLLELALGTVELHHSGRLGMISITLDMIRKSGAYPGDSEKFINYPRFIAGVEVAALIKQIGENNYKFSLRSNGNVNVAKLAANFGGGGHAKAAGFECKGELSILKKRFLDEVLKFLN